MKHFLYNLAAGLSKSLLNTHYKGDTEMYDTSYPIQSIQRKNFYNVGAGNFHHPYWTNIDDNGDFYTPEKGRDSTHLVHDLFQKNPFPINDNEAELIYSSHTIEHIDNDSVLFFLKESNRILKKNGVIRLVVPDINLSHRAWRTNDSQFFHWTKWEQFSTNLALRCLNIPLRDASLSQVFLEDFAAAASEIVLVGAEKRISDKELNELFDRLTMEQALDYCISFCSVQIQKQFPFQHMNWFNETKLTRMLEESNFSKIYRSAYLQSAVPVLRNSRYFDGTMPEISFYMEAVK